MNFVGVGHVTAKLREILLDGLKVLNDQEMTEKMKGIFKDIESEEDLKYLRLICLSETTRIPGLSAA